MRRWPSGSFSLNPVSTPIRCHAAQQCDELAPLHRADPKPKDHAEYSRSRPCIAAKAARSCPSWVKLGRSAMSAQCPVCPKADTAGRFMSTRPSAATPAVIMTFPPWKEMRKASLSSREPQGVHCRAPCPPLRRSHKFGLGLSLKVPRHAVVEWMGQFRAT
jgi:hypothetical protein